MNSPTDTITPTAPPGAGNGLAEQEVLERLRPLITEVTGVPPREIAIESVLMTDLGAESIDLLDLSFLVEEQFGITIEPNEFESRARARIPGGVFEKDGCLTDAALAELRQLLPEVRPDRLTAGLRRADLPTVLTVGVLVHLIQRKAAEKDGGVGHA
ncbi:MAG: acyl carrier protein [Planctomycetota bacterium]|nr:acyl carrier protein [Planctomycetota bacterium]